MLSKGPQVIIHNPKQFSRAGKGLHFANLTRDVLTMEILSRVPRGQGQSCGVQLSFSAGVTVHLVIATLHVLR